MKLRNGFFIALVILCGCVEKADWQDSEKEIMISPPGICRTPEENRKLGISPAPFDRSLLPEILKVKSSGESYIIPTVFHVFGTNFGSGRTVSYELVDDALRRTNEDFQGLTDDWIDVDPPFDAIKQKLGIEFRLADFDPEGNLTAGVIFHPEEKGLGNASGYNEIVQKYAWDNYKYKNVYILYDLYDDGGTNNSGISWYPNTWMSDNNLARTVYNGAYLGNNTNDNFRSVLTHEFGHWLNLLHTFEGGCSEAALTGGDEVVDTPPADRMYMGPTDLNCFGSITNWQNFMNYTDNYANFTQGQVERMLVALQHPSRKPIWQQDNLHVTLLPQNVSALIPEKGSFEENILINDGTVNGKCQLTVKRGKLAALPSTYLDATAYSVTDLPEGIECKIWIRDADLLEMTLSGKALEHAAKNSSNFQVKFENSILETGILYQDTYDFYLGFVNPYEIRYTVCDKDLSANNPSLTVSIETAYLQSELELKYTGGNLIMNTNGNQVTIEQYSQNISTIHYGTTLDNKVSWKQGELILYSREYQKWDGLSGYIGFRAQGNTEQEVLYGWIKVKVSEGGSSCSILGYGWNELPGVPIFAGQKLPDEVPVMIDFSADKVVLVVDDRLDFTALVTPEDQILSYNWAFEGANPSVSEEKNPREIIYAVTGSFDVKLTVKHQSGEIIEVRKENYIRVYPGIDIGDTGMDWSVPELVIVGISETTFLKVASGNKIITGNMKLYDSRNKLIFSKDNYTGDYDLARLKAGTYYYVFVSEGKTLKGVIELIRK